MSFWQAVMMFVIVHFVAVALEMLTGGSWSDVQGTVASVALWVALRGARDEWVQS